MKRPILVMPAILLFLALLIVAPMVVMGIQNERNARAALAAGDNLKAAQQFERAARLLFLKPELWNEAGNAFIAGFSFDKAHAAYMIAQSKNVLDACSWMRFGFTEMPDEELQVWLSGLRQYPDSFWLSYYISAFYFDSKDYELEKRYLLSALEHEDNVLVCGRETFNTGFLHYRAGVLLMQDDPTRALDELNTASRLDDQYAPAVETLSATLNLAALEADPAAKLVVIGRGLGLAEEWQLAAQVFHNATQADPENASAWAWFGTAQAQLGKDALSAFERAESINPDSIDLLSLRGLYLQRIYELEAAQADFEKLAALEPDNPQWQNALGSIYADSGDLPTALAAYEKAIELDSIEPAYVNALALFSFNYRYDMVGIGLPAARRAVILAPQDVQSIDTLGLLYLGVEQSDEAEKQFLRALEKDSEYAPAYLHLGMLYLQRGHLDLARSALNNANAFATDQAVRMQVQHLLDEYFAE